VSRGSRKIGNKNSKYSRIKENKMEKVFKEWKEWKEFYKYTDTVKGQEFVIAPDGNKWRIFITEWGQKTIEKVKND
jgi:hypothetical protein